MLASLGLLFFQGAKEFFSFMKEKIILKKKVETAVLENNARLALAKETNNSAWETAQLADKDKLLRISAFILFSSTFWSNFISPELGSRVANAWHMMPHWQATTLSGMSLAVFGIRQATNLVGGAVGTVVQALKNNKKT